MIQAIALSKVYYQGNSKIEAVKDVELKIDKGNSVLITGPSGAGKSTLLHLIGGLEAPSEGEVLFEGVNFYKLSDRERSIIRNEKIGFVFQFYHLLPEFTVLENVMLPALIGRKKFRNKNEIEKRAEALLKIAGLLHRTNHKPSELSGGEAQRAAIARALIQMPDILLCDEPTGNLDSKMGRQVLDYLWLVREKNKTALVIVSHETYKDFSFDKKYTMEDGRLEEGGDFKGLS